MGLSDGTGAVGIEVAAEIMADVVGGVARAGAAADRGEHGWRRWRRPARLHLCPSAARSGRTSKEPRRLQVACLTEGR